MIILFAIIQLTLSYSDPNCNSAYCSDCVSGQPDKCTSCIDKYILQKNKCVYERNVHCEKSSHNVCLKCEKGYEWDNIDFACVKGEDGCEQYSEDGNSCETCKTGYLYTSGSCIQCPENPNCKSFDGSCSNCVDCGHVFGLTNGKCNATVQHCSKYSKNTCIDCVLGYMLQDGQCVRGKIDNCLTYEQNPETYVYECKKCLDTFILDSETGQCVLEEEYILEGCDKMASLTKCLNCKTNYHMTTDFKCEKCPTGCKDCTVKNVCNDCFIGFTLENGECIKDEYGLFECPEDATNQEDCMKYNPRCIYTKVVNDHYCVYKGMNCTEWDDSMKCTSCVEGYVVDESNQMACIPSTKGCAQYATVTKDGKEKTVCISCYDGFFIKEDFTCEPCGAMCYEGKCTHEANQCDVYRCSDFGCLKCSDSITECEQCPHNLKFTDGWCGPDTCADYLETGECNMCVHYSLEQKYDVVLEMMIPESYYFYIPNEEGNCGDFVPIPDDETDDDDEDEETDYTVYYILAGIAGGLIGIILIGLLVVGIVYLVHKRRHRNNDYQILE